MTASSSSPSSSSPKGKTVTFSQYSQLAVVPRAEFPDSCWYSPKDKTRFHRTVAKDVMRMMQVIEDTPADAKFTPEQLYEFVGIEIFVTKGMAGYVAAARRAHVRAVLAQQHRQWRQGKCSPEDLAQVSKMMSAKSEERAQKLASGYAEVSERNV